MRTPRLDIVVPLLLLIVTCPVALADDDTGGEFGIIGGVSNHDGDITGPGTDSPKIDFSAGLHGGYVFSERWGWFVDVLFSEIDTDPVFDDATGLTLRTGVNYLYNPSKDARWFLSLGGGLTDIDYGAGSSFDFDYPFASLGVGQRVWVKDRQRFRWEFRFDHSFDDEGPFSEGIAQAHLIFGWMWSPGGKDVDSDGDGVVDRRDECPGTPRGATVDIRGCPTDSDGDKVLDGIDRCPDTPKGWPVDSTGCPMDSDGDKVPDGKDACPDTPRGATVDDRGCPLDSDGDGVYDGIDKCPRTPKGAEVDGNGCPKDADGDGVFDGLDRCPDTPKGTKVDTNGCPVAKPLFKEGKKTLVLEGVFFATDRAVLTGDSKTVLDRVVRSLLDFPEVRVEVGGHTDSSGSDAYNLKLSERRARAVGDYLVSKGVSAGRLAAKGYGEGQPIADNGTAAGRAKNRRVELKKLD